MQDLDLIIFTALTNDEAIVQAVGNRVKSTAFEVPPTEADNTPLPYIIVTDDGFQNQDGTKDSVWESAEDQVQATIEIAADSPNEVKRLTRLCRKAVSSHIEQILSSGEDAPMLNNLHSDGIAWDWSKPCYFTHLIYNCTISTDDYEQEQ